MKEYTTVLCHLYKDTKQIKLTYGYKIRTVAALEEVSRGEEVFSWKRNEGAYWVLEMLYDHLSGSHIHICHIHIHT